MSRSDEDDRSGSPDHRHHARHPAQAVLEGALVLSNTIAYMPVGIHLAVVDPGVGGPRRPLALRDEAGRLFVGPDNGLLLPAANRAGIAEAHELANPEYALEAVSRTFHGRDLFSPAAAHLANGVPLAELGPPLDLRRSSVSTSPSRLSRTGCRRDAALRRQLREHRSQPHARGRRRAGDRLGDEARARACRRALLRGHGEDVRRRAPG